MLFDIYLITVLISMGINLSNFTNVLIKLKRDGYEFERIFIPNPNSKTSKSFDNKGISLGTLIGIAMLFLTIILSLIPVFNVVHNISTLNNWTYSINHLISLLQNNRFVYNKYSFFEDEIKKNKSLFQIKKLSYKHSDIVSKEMIESMYLEGVNENKIKDQLRKSKKERVKYLKKISELLKLYNNSLVNAEITTQSIAVDAKLEVENTKIKIK